MSCLLFCEHLGTLLAEINLRLDICAFVILKNINLFQFLVKVVCKRLFFHDLSSIVFLKISKVVLVVTSCIDEIILAEIIFWVINL